jgi:hypothetical protein
MFHQADKQYRHTYNLGLENNKDTYKAVEHKQLVVKYNNQNQYLKLPCYTYQGFHIEVWEYTDHKYIYRNSQDRVYYPQYKL